MKRAVLDELRALGPATAASLQWAEACCEVLDNPPPPGTAPEEGEDSEEAEQAPAMSAGEAIRALVGARNEGRYMVATQDQELKADLRHVPSVALLFVARAVLLMEPPSDTSRAQSAVAEKSKVRKLDEEERALLAAVKGKGKGQGQGGQPQQQQQQRQQAKVRLKKKAKGPNPLSMKKGKKDKSGGGKKDKGEGRRPDGAAAAAAAAAAEKKRKRKHKKKPKGEGGGGGAA